MIILLIYACLAHATSAQRYNERNIVPAADNLPSSNNDEYDNYRFEDEDEPIVYKWNVEEYPHPKNNSRFCNRLKPSNVCDPDMVLTKEHAGRFY